MPLRVLVTRAADDAPRTLARLQAAGHVGISAPLIEIVATGANLPDVACDAILATSAHALTGVSQLPPALRGAAWFVVGERLADALAQRGLGCPDIVARDVETLLDEIAARHPAAGRFVYLAGRDRKPALEDGLLQRRRDIIVVETYEARACETLDTHVVDALRRSQIDAVLHFSRRSATLFIAVVGRIEDFDGGRLRHIAISAEAAAPLVAQGWRVETAATPDEAAMLDRLASD